MSPDAWAEAEGWLASLNLLLAGEMQAVFPEHTAFCLCHGGISPKMLPQLSAIHFGVAALPAAFTGLFPNNIPFAVVSDQLFPLLYALDFGLESITWASSLQRSPPCLHSPTASADGRVLWVTGRNGDTSWSHRAGWQGSSPMGSQAERGGSHTVIFYRKKYPFIQSNYPNLVSFRDNCSAFI